MLKKLQPGLNPTLLINDQRFRTSQLNSARENFPDAIILVVLLFKQALLQKVKKYLNVIFDYCSVSILVIIRLCLVYLYIRVVHIPQASLIADYENCRIEV